MLLAHLFEMICDHDARIVADPWGTIPCGLLTKCKLRNVEIPILAVAILTTFSTVAQVRATMMKGIAVRTWK